MFAEASAQPLGRPQTQGLRRHKVQRTGPRPADLEGRRNQSTALAESVPRVEAVAAPGDTIGLLGLAGALLHDIVIHALHQVGQLSDDVYGIG